MMSLWSLIDCYWLSFFFTISLTLTFSTLMKRLLKLVGTLKWTKADWWQYELPVCPIIFHLHMILACLLTPFSFPLFTPSRRVDVLQCTITDPNYCLLGSISLALSLSPSRSLPHCLPLSRRRLPGTRDDVVITSADCWSATDGSASLSARREIRECSAQVQGFN